MEAEHRRAIGRPRSIDREKIVAAAHRLGLEKLTMRAVAAELGVTTQALYNHIGGRRELLVLLANDYSELFELDLDEETATWRGWLTEFARSLRTICAPIPAWRPRWSPRARPPPPRCASSSARWPSWVRRLHRARGVAGLPGDPRVRRRLVPAQRSGTAARGG
ncbi:MAG: helix-turn-helix domain-containing protein [Acidimicrobiales bacterium]